MNAFAPLGAFEEIELKLALSTSDTAGLAKRLGRTPVLARRKPTQRQLHNVYYDTPEQVLRQQRVALRLRRVGTGAKPQWLQTLKTGGSSDSALSQRGEWEAPVTRAALSSGALEDTPWASIDPDGSVFAALVPCFVTRFERTTWLVRRRDRSVVEVALDIGQIEANGKTAPICELELELHAGSPDALFALAQEIAAGVAVMPLSQSKAQRGYALAQNVLNAPLRAQPVVLSPEWALPEVARRVLREMFTQFTTNLHALRSSDAPELVHQARVGWRRFRSALRLFKPAVQALPSWDALHALLASLGELRDLDVALTETLPSLLQAYTLGEPQRAQAWQAMMQTLMDATQRQRQALRDATESPAVGASLLAITQWLECPSPTGRDEATVESDVSLRSWSRRRISRLHKQLWAAHKNIDNPQSQHPTRNLAKRLRYGIEALRPLLARRRTDRWYQQALDLQTGIGATRDILRASALVAGLDADPGLQEFLRGVAVGRDVVTIASK